MGIGINLKRALREHELTVAELSRKTGISSNTFYAMIRRDNNKISPEMLKKICDNTDISVYELLDNYDGLAAKYYDPMATKEEQDIGDYILTTIKNDENLGHIIEIYEKLNNVGKNMAYEHISELETDSQFAGSNSDSDIQKYNDAIRIKYEPTSEKLERIRLDAEAEEIIKRQASGEEITAEECQKVSDYIKRTKESYSTVRFKINNIVESLNKAVVRPFIDRESSQIFDEFASIILEKPDKRKKLNDIGKKKVDDYIEDLSNIPDYQNKLDEPSEE